MKYVEIGFGYRLRRRDPADCEPERRRSAKARDALKAVS